MQLLSRAAGGYRFLTGIAPYSAGVVALPDYEIVQVTLDEPRPYEIGLEQVRRYLAERRRPLQALCAVELRLPEPLSFQGFMDFNQSYQDLLVQWGLIEGGINPIARTNVAPVVRPPAQPCLYGFSYTVPITTPSASPTFVVAGAGDLHDQAVMSPAAVVRPGEHGHDALQEKAAVVMQVMQERLFGLGCTWQQVSRINVYTEHHLQSWLEESVVAQVGPAIGHGLCWYLSRPPIADLAFEMDLRGVRQSLVWSPGT